MCVFEKADLTYFLLSEQDIGHEIVGIFMDFGDLGDWGERALAVNLGIQ